MNYRSMKSYELRKLLGALGAADRTQVLQILQERKHWARKNKPRPSKKKKKKRNKLKKRNGLGDTRAEMLRKRRRDTTKRSFV